MKNAGNASDNTRRVGVWGEVFERDSLNSKVFFFVSYLILFSIGFLVHQSIKPTFSFIDHVLPRPFLSEPIGTLLTWGVWVPVLCSPLLFRFCAQTRLWRWTIFGGISISVIASTIVAFSNFSSFELEIVAEGFSIYIVIFGGTTLILGFVVFLFRALSKLILART